MRLTARSLLLALLSLLATPVRPQAAAPLRLLFLGDSGHHEPGARYRQIKPFFDSHGIESTYTERLEDLTPATLAPYDVLLLYANHTAISPEQEAALLSYVEGGKGFLPIHCASYCFLNSPKFTALVGAQFKSHGTGVFQEHHVRPGHPVLAGLHPIESWDETYVHTRHGEDRVVLSERRDPAGLAEPYTWVRQQGKGRVFYTAWGHDQRTWGTASFQALLESGIRWAAGAGPAMASLDLRPNPGLDPLPYTNAPSRIPNYPGGNGPGGSGDSIGRMQLPLPPAESARHIAVPEGFSSTLWAADPDILKPICMAWDERGRLWIAETVDYPNEQQPQGSGRDRIKICEDTDGDGRADKFTLFADKLSIPTGMAFANGGLIVIEGGHTLFLRDTNGDDVADERRVLFSGWNMGDTHATASNLHWGFDNWIWGTVGYSGFEGEVGGRHVRFSMGVFRFKPDGSALEFIRSSNNNTWGLGLSEEGLIFGSTANNNASWFMPIPNRHYEAVGGWSAGRMETIADSQAFYPITTRVRQVDFHGRYTAAAGHALYTARSFPEDYWNRVAFVAEPTGHLVGRFRLDSVGADFTARNEHSFLASDDEWTAPVAAEVGPDGALWVLDWYNYIVQHNPTPAGFSTGRGNAYETPLRDKRHGRIYRVAWKGAPGSARPNLSPERPEAWVEALHSDNLLWRMHAQRLLVERSRRDLIPALATLAQDRSIDRIGLNTAVIHALWTLDGLHAFTEAPAMNALTLALTHPSAGVRRTAVTLLPRTPGTGKELERSGLLADADPQVRLAALLALAEMPPSETAGPLLLAALKEDGIRRDRWLAQGAIAAAARHDAAFLKAVLAGVRPPEETLRKKPAPAANLLPNAGFELEQQGRPQDWHPVTYGGRADFKLDHPGHGGTSSARIHSDTGSDASFSHRVEVEPNRNYRLSAWIRTEEVRGAMGALLNVHELQGEQTVRTQPLSGTHDWTRVEARFNSGELRSLTINCLFGGWGASRGTAWYDDIELVAAGPDLALPGALGLALRTVTGHYAQRAPVESVIPTLMTLGSAAPGIAIPFLEGLASGWPNQRPPSITAVEAAALVERLHGLPPEARSPFITLAEKWGKTDLFAGEVQALAAEFGRQVSDATLGDEPRADAARRLIPLADRPENSRLVLGQVTPLSSPALVAGFIEAASLSRRPETGESLVELLPRITPAARRSATAALLRRGDWALSLLAALEAGRLQRTDIAGDHWTQLKAHADATVASRARDLDKRAGIAASPDMEATVKRLLPIATQRGDAARGRELFTTTCAICHTFEGQGARIGPELTGIGARPRQDILVDIIDPNRSVEANYRMWTATLKNGDTYSGRLETETVTTVELLDTAGQKHILQRAEVAELKASNLSLMPAGFEQLPAADLAALLEYLGQSTHPAAAR